MLSTPLLKTEINKWIVCIVDKQQNGKPQDRHVADPACDRHRAILRQHAPFPFHPEPLHRTACQQRRRQKHPEFPVHVALHQNDCAVRHKHIPNKGKCLPDRVRAEENPADQHNKHRIDMRQRPEFLLLQPFSQKTALQHVEKAMVNAPENERPARSVPDAGQQKHRPKVDIRPRRAPPVSAERNVHVLFKPAGEGNMPFPPEILDRSRCIRQPEVFNKCKAKHFSKPNRHVKKKKKIEINLQHIEKRRQPEHRLAHIRRLIRVDRVHHLGKGICQDDLLSQTENKAFHAIRKALQRDGPVFDLLLDVMVFHDRSRYELREEGNIKHHVERIFLRLIFAPVHIHHVGKRLEGIEGNSDRQRHLNRRKRYIKPAKQRIQHLGEEIVIFKIAEDQKIERHAERQKPSLFPEFLHQTPETVVEQNRKNHEHHIPRFAPGIEKEAEYGQDAVFERFGAHVVEEQDAGEKNP